MPQAYSAAELSSNTISIIDEAKSSKKPVYITQNGNASTILIDADTYLTQMQALSEFKRIFAEQTAAKAEAQKPVKIGWRCPVCGHIEYVDELPADYVCPICGVPGDTFERIEVPAE